MNRSIRVITAGACLPLAVAGLTACGGKSSSASSTPAAAATGTAATSAARSGGARGGFGAQFSDPKVLACLKAAGITIPTRVARPSGSFSGFPSGARPSGSRGALPSGARPSGGFGGLGGNSAEGQKIQAALKACGITLPTRTRTAQPTGAAPTTAS